MNELRFGGAIGTIQDPQTGIQIHPRCMGQATLSVPTNETTVRASITQHVAEQLEVAMRSGKSFAQAANDTSLANKVAAAVSAQLHISVSITVVHPELGGNVPLWALWLRLPFQFLFIAWAWWVSWRHGDPPREAR